MRKLRVALGSDDGEHLINDHMGQAGTFYIFDLFEDGQWQLVARRANTSPREEGDEHGKVTKLKAASQIFRDADVVLARRGSPNFVRMRDTTKFQPVVSRMDAIDEAMAALARSFDAIHVLVMRRRQGERPKEIPVLRAERRNQGQTEEETVAT